MKIFERGDEAKAHNGGSDENGGECEDDNAGLGYDLDEEDDAQEEDADLYEQTKGLKAYVIAIYERRKLTVSGTLKIMSKSARTPIGKDNPG